MRGRPGVSRHLDDAAALDYLEDRLTGARRRAVERHLGTPCAACRERVQDYGRLLDWLRRDRVPEVPVFLRDRALAAFQPVRRAGASPPLTEALAALLFDSWARPLPAAARRAVGDVRRLRFGLGDHVLELELEPETRESATLRGWLEAPDPALHRIEIRAGSETRVRQPDARGAFAFERIPPGSVHVLVTGPSGRWALDLSRDETP